MRNDSEADVVRLDGNALAGPLAEATGVDSTADRMRCGSCDAEPVVAQLIVVVREGRAVGWCPTCGAEMLVVVRRALTLGDGVSWVG